MDGVRVAFLPACIVEGIFDGLEAIRSVQPSLDLSSLAGGGQPHHGSSSHAVAKDTTVGSASKLQRPAHMATFHKAGFLFLFYTFYFFISDHGSVVNSENETSAVTISISVVLQSSNAHFCAAQTHSNRSTASIGTGDQAALCCCQGNLELPPVQMQGSSHTHRYWHVANHILTAGTHDLKMV